MGNPECFAFEGGGARSATACARLVSRSLLLKLDHCRRIAHRDLNICLTSNRCRRIIDVLPYVVMGVGRHRLIEAILSGRADGVSPRQCRYDCEHLTAGQSQIPAAIERGLCDGGRPDTHALSLNEPQDRSVGSASPQCNSTL